MHDSFWVFRNLYCYFRLLSYSVFPFPSPNSSYPYILISVAFQHIFPWQYPTFTILVSAIDSGYVLPDEYLELGAPGKREHATFVFLELEYINVIFSSSIHLLSKLIISCSFTGIYYSMICRERRKMARMQWGSSNTKYVLKLS